MRNIVITALLICLAAGVASCGSKDKQETDEARAPKAEVFDNAKGPQQEDMTNTYDLKVGGKAYQVTVHRVSDTEKPALKDDFGDEFFDNRISVTIQRDEETIVQRDFSLESFESYIPAKHKGKVVLQGMAPDEGRSTQQGIVFGVSVGMPGSDEGEVLLALTLVPGSDKIDIRKDDAPEFYGHIE
ncbi:MAG: DUF4738 domain-containing protein [Bacteroidaceae bacterium]|nr:DUF4738 domain-containing protein [Bacteroidaceae bacterium]